MQLGASARVISRIVLISPPRSSVMPATREPGATRSMIACAWSIEIASRGFS
ncbi:hypothetical protein [Bradyrhizobium sp. BR 1433]|uniref:hypothetical protein n=1 Tax=Bradyrhizobium sp. BR 1433 TaxID=3447967 RepID=UPI003EE61A01